MMMVMMVMKLTSLLFLEEVKIEQYLAWKVSCLN